MQDFKACIGFVGYPEASLGYVPQLTNIHETSSLFIHKEVNKDILKAFNSRPTWALRKYSCFFRPCLTELSQCGVVVILMCLNADENLLCLTRMVVN